MSVRAASAFDKTLAKVCANCLVCRRARRRQPGVAFWLVKRVEAKLGPFCRAYERVYGCKAYDGSRNRESPAVVSIPPML